MSLELKEERAYSKTASTPEDETFYTSVQGDYEEDQVPPEVNELIERNDLTVLKGQLSSDELVSNLDIMKTEHLIALSKSEEEEQKLFAQPMSVVLWEIFKKGSINLILPFFNGIMLGFGEILAHEIGFRYNWVGARVQPARRMTQRGESRSSQFL